MTEELFDEIWRELLRCSVCKERIAVVSVKKTTSNEGSIFGETICIKCLPKFVEQITHSPVHSENLVSSENVPITPLKLVAFATNSTENLDD